MRHRINERWGPQRWVGAEWAPCPGPISRAAWISNAFYYSHKDMWTHLSPWQLRKQLFHLHTTCGLTEEKGDSTQQTQPITAKTTSTNKFSRSSASERQGLRLSFLYNIGLFLRPLCHGSRGRQRGLTSTGWEPEAPGVCCNLGFGRPIPTSYWFKCLKNTSYILVMLILHFP